ncbi:hypothetical protein ACJMK2_023344 [Sinanodonta woodiana]|uniref:Uncharacterized protein n=1 Tax=Sinanodonta woodiana TaxID=1069815 RepID=A0ABD3T5I1_SINWO
MEESAQTDLLVHYLLRTKVKIHFIVVKRKDTGHSSALREKRRNRKNKRKQSGFKKKNVLMMRENLCL